jgi:replicative DNA helicase
LATAHEHVLSGVPISFRDLDTLTNGWRRSNLLEQLAP